LSGDKLQSRFSRVWVSVLLGAAACVAAPAACALAAGDSAFTVGNYPVQARAENAVKAKEKAIADGQQAAFRSLLKRIVPVTSYSVIDRLRSVRAVELIAGYSVRSERNSNTEYIASLDFAFQADAVRNLLRREAVPFIEEQAPVTVLVPVMRGGQSGDEAKWSGTWKGLDLDHTLTPVRLEQLKPQIHPDTLQMLESGDGGAIRILNGEYRGNAVVAIADYDSAAKRLNVTFAGQDGAGPIAWKRSYRLVDNDLDYTMELAAVVGLGVLEGRWKAVKVEGSGGGGPAAMGAAPYGGTNYGSGSNSAYGSESAYGSGSSSYGSGSSYGGSYGSESAYGSEHTYDSGPGFGTSYSSGGEKVAIDVQFSSVDEWDDLRRQILDTPGVDDVAVASISDSNAEMSLVYPGGGSQLAAVLSRQGLRMHNSGGTWVLQSGR
jgi:hypothetical protein